MYVWHIGEGFMRANSTTVFNLPSSKVIADDTISYDLSKYILTIKEHNFKQELSEDNIVCQWQLNLNSNCQLVCVEYKVKVFVYRGWYSGYENSSSNIYNPVN